MRNCKKKNEVGVGKMNIKHFLSLLNLSASALQSELSKVSISNFVKLQLQRKYAIKLREHLKILQNFP